ncbi:MAG: hypothetical protein JNK58_03370 [Phycisphaerae bacterium]|nr:hypothetical protein [Phycisphaerae bacterium]
MRDPELSEMVRLRLYAEQHRLIDDPLGNAVRQVLDAGVEDEFISDELRGRVRKHRIARAFAGPFETPRLEGGDLCLGTDLNGRLLWMPSQFMNGHSLTVGNSGSGKTTKSKFNIVQMARLVGGLWAFDLRKAEFASTAAAQNAQGLETTVLRPHDVKLNPLQVPEGSSPGAWAPRIAEAIGLALRLPPRATKLVHTRILMLFDEFGVMAQGDQAERFPTLFDLRESVAADRHAHPAAKHALVDSLDPILLSLGQSLAFYRGWSSSDLARFRIVFELGAIGEAAKDLILTSILSAEFMSRVARGYSNAPMDLFVVCDEAGSLLSSSAHAAGLSDLLGLVRGTGIGLDLSTQTANIAPGFLSNTANKFLGRVGSATDLETIGNAMGLTSEQRRWACQNLTPGLFIGQLGEGEWRRPFVFRVPSLQRSTAAAAAVPNVIRNLPLLPSPNRS